MTLLLEPEPAEIVAPVPGYDVHITPEVVDGEVVYLAVHPSLPGCRSHGSTPREAEDNLADARSMYLEALEDSFLPIPEPKAHPQSMIATLFETAPASSEARAAGRWTVTVPGGGEMTLGAVRSTVSRAR